MAADYVKAHASKVTDVMTRDVIAASPDTPLHEVATLMEKNSIKRVLILSDGQLVGVVSRANLVQRSPARAKVTKFDWRTRSFAKSCSQS